MKKNLNKIPEDSVMTNHRDTFHAVNLHTSTCADVSRDSLFSQPKKPVKSVLNNLKEVKIKMDKCHNKIRHRKGRENAQNKIISLLKPKFEEIIVHNKFSTK